MSLPVIKRKLFVTVGAQMPFDRLVKAVDEWATGRDDVEIFAQTGEEGYAPVNFQSDALCSPTEFRERLLWADLLVAHAGMGSILQALQFGKPILVMPRKGSLRETRNDHQVATAIRFKEMGKVRVAMDERELGQLLSDVDGIGGAQVISDRASDELIAALRSFIFGQ